ncbi:hypothetical protein Ahia01_001257100 [Argonauta hians]
MNGHLISGTPIAVDFWKVRQCPNVKLFFLSHFHGDHTMGLSSTWSEPIYCSKITGELICKKFSIEEELIRPLELNTPSIIPLDATLSETITVVALDANHCPGSLMFLFRGYFGCVLYTGDFRYEPKVIDNSYLSQLDCTIDTLYLDNTFLDPKCNFPTRDKTRDWILEFINCYFHSHCIVLGMHRFGKPFLLVEIAKYFKQKIAVPASMFEYLEILDVPKLFFIDDKKMEYPFRVVPFYQVNRKYMSACTKPTIAILPTGIYVGIATSLYVNQQDIKVIPYSDHSSYLEIIDFVKRIRPKQVIPIVGAETKGPFDIPMAERADMSCLNPLLSKSPLKRYSIPKQLSCSKKSPAVNKKSSHKTATKRPSVKGVIFDSPKKASPSKQNSEKGELQPSGESNRNVALRQGRSDNNCNSNNTETTVTLTGAKNNTETAATLPDSSGITETTVKQAGSRSVTTETIVALPGTSNNNTETIVALPGTSNNNTETIVAVPGRIVKRATIVTAAGSSGNTASIAAVPGSSGKRATIVALPGSSGNTETIVAAAGNPNNNNNNNSRETSVKPTNNDQITAPGTSRIPSCYTQATNVKKKKIICSITNSLMKTAKEKELQRKNTGDAHLVSTQHSEESNCEKNPQQLRNCNISAPNANRVLPMLDQLYNDPPSNCTSHQQKKDNEKGVRGKTESEDHVSESFEEDYSISIVYDSKTETHQTPANRPKRRLSVDNILPQEPLNKKSKHKVPSSETENGPLLNVETNDVTVHGNSQQYTLIQQLFQRTESDNCLGLIGELFSREDKQLRRYAIKHYQNVIESVVLSQRQFWKR